MVSDADVAAWLLAGVLFQSALRFAVVSDPARWTDRLMDWMSFNPL